MNKVIFRYIPNQDVVAEQTEVGLVDLRTAEYDGAYCYMPWPGEWLLGSGLHLFAGDSFWQNVKEEDVPGFMRAQILLLNPK